MKSRRLALAFLLSLVLILVDDRYPAGMAAASSEAVSSSALAADLGCTAFCLDNAGHGVFGANLDENFSDGYLYVNQRHVSKTGWNPNPAGEYARWTSKYGSLTFNLVGYQMPWAGMNEAGLTISTMLLAETQVPEADERPPLQSTLWLQYQLDNYSSVEQVIASESLVRLAPGARDHYLVCDASGKCATIEFLEGKMVHHTGETLPVAALANTVYAESFKAWQAGQTTDPYYNSLRRFGTAADRVTSFQATSSTDAVGYAFETLAQVKNPDLTVWSLVFDAQSRRAYFRTIRNEEIRYVDFSQLDFSCGRPVQMLEIHKALSGDVSADFMPYSHELSFAHLKKSLPYFGVHIPDDWVVKLLEQVENYPCVQDEEQIAQETPLAKGEQEITQAAPLVKVKVEEQAGQAAPRSFFPTAWLAAALLTIILLLILYGIRRGAKHG